MRKKYQWVQVVVLLFVVFAVYVPKINHTAGIDEIMTFFKYTRSFSDITLYDAPNNHILHSFLVWLSTSLMGNSLIVIRLPAFLSSFLALAVLYRLGRRWGNHDIALIAVMLMSITQDFFSYTVDGRGYTLTVLFALLLIETVPMPERYMSRNKGIYAFFVSIGILLLIPSNGFLIAPIVGWQCLVAFYKRKPKYLLNSIPYILAVIICGAFYALQLLTTFPDGLSQEFYVGFRNLNGFIYQSAVTLFYNPVFDIFVLAAVFLWGVLVSLRYYHRYPQYILIACIFIGAVLLTLVQWIVTYRLFFPRNFLYLLPLIAFIGAVGIYQLSKFRLNLIVPLLLAAGGMWGILPLDQNTHIAAQLAAIEEHSSDGDVLFVGAGYYDPIYYHVRVQGDTSRDYFMPSDETDRFVLMPTAMDVETLVSLYELEPYIDQCGEEDWNGYSVITCPIVNGPYTGDNSRCFVSVYPYWRQCGEEDQIQASA